VYLGVKRLRWEDANVAPPSGTTWNGGAADQAQRFSIQELTTPDLLTPDGRDCSVQYLCYEVQILFDDELTNHQDYELMKIAELLRSAEGQGTFLSRRYIPPCLTIHASAVLDSMLKELRELLTAKGRELSEYKRQHKMHTIDISSKDTVFLLMMQTVNRYIPLFHHHLEIEETHPCTVYALVRQLVGDLSTFSEDTTALGDPVRPLPPYRHDRLWECFDPALHLAKELLNEITKGPDYVVPLEWDGREYFAANNIEKRFFEGINRYYLSIKVDIPPRELLALLTETGKISSHDDMPELRGKFLPGLKIDYQEIPPEELPRRAYYSYFLIDHRWALGVHLWRTIEERRDIAVFCELPPEKTEMRLLVIFGT
jgi:type VI secretion system protein ImpJ